MNKKRTALVTAIIIGITLFIVSMAAGCAATLDDARRTVIAITTLHKAAEDELVRRSGEEQEAILERARQSGDRVAGLQERDAFRAKRAKVEEALAFSMVATRTLAEAINYGATKDLKPLIAAALDAAMKVRSTLANLGVSWLTPVKP